MLGFIPKLHLISHEKILRLLLITPSLQLNLYRMENGKITINQDCLVELFKLLYCPKKQMKHITAYDDVRALTIGKRDDKSSKGGFTTNDPRKWLPPKTAINRLGELIQLQIDYLQNAGIHGAENPNFLLSNTLKQNSSGEIEYDFGPDSRFENFEDLPSYQQVKRKSGKRKRQINSTPQKGMRRKRVVTSTPNPARRKTKC